MTELREFIKMSSGSHPRIVKGLFMSIGFTQGEHRINYIPSLNLSSYGKDQQEADEMMSIQLKEAIAALNKCSHSDLIKELKELGWEKSPYFGTELSKSAHVDKEGILRDFDLPEDTAIEEQLMTV